jgi:hypothetical protein
MQWSKFSLVFIGASFIMYTLAFIIYWIRPAFAFIDPLMGGAYHRQHCDKRYSYDARNISESYNPFFRRPKPVIQEQPFGGGSGFQNVNVFGVDTIIFKRDAKELWVNVRNEGQTSVKRMRARVRIVSLQPLVKHMPQVKPDNMPEDHWTRLIQKQQEFLARTDQEFNQSVFGTPLPFIRIPSGTTALPWTQLDRMNVYEVDLTPNDEASIRLVGLYPLEEAGRISLEHVIKVEDEHARLVAHQIGAMSGVVTNPISDGTFAFNLAVKFQIIAENLTVPVFEIFHLEIPTSYDTIICSKYKMGTKEYNELNKRLSL